MLISFMYANGKLCATWVFGGNILDLCVILIDTFQNKISADQYLMTTSRAQV